MIQLRPLKMALMLPRTHSRTLLASLAAAALLAGCANTPQQTPASHPARLVVPAAKLDHGSELTIGSAVAELAMGMVGARYRYGGTDPAEGFDCSGLAFYAYTQAGYRIPRTSQEQFRAARKIALGDADAGDLVFFQDQTTLRCSRARTARPALRARTRAHCARSQRCAASPAAARRAARRRAR
jgi:cell wall-associated NlpC family hydrolase